MGNQLQPWEEVVGRLDDVVEHDGYQLLKVGNQQIRVPVTVEVPKIGTRVAVLRTKDSYVVTQQTDD